MIVDFKKMLKTLPATVSKDRVKELESIAFVKHVDGWSIEGYSPVFKDITVNANHGKMSCRRGDVISIKLSSHGTNDFELIENITLTQEIQKFEQQTTSCLYDSEKQQFLQWRDAQLSKQKQH